MRAGDDSGGQGGSGSASGGTGAGAGAGSGAGSGAGAGVRGTNATGGAGAVTGGILRRSGAPGGGGASDRSGLVSGATTMPTGFVVHDFAEYLRGVWKRNLEWRHFGGSYEHVRTSSTVVAIEEVKDKSLLKGVRALKWSFGTSTPSSLRFGYQMQFLPDAKGETFMQWQYGGNTCTGNFRPGLNIATLQFLLRDSTVTITYRAMDLDTMAVCIVEVNNRHTPTIQYGNMCRVKEHLYRAMQEQQAQR